MKHYQGFTIIEILVALSVMGVIIIGLSSLLITIDTLQSRSHRAAIATRIAESKIESLRNNHYNTLPVSPPDINFTGELPAELLEPRSATVNVSEPAEGIKRLDVTITYQDGDNPRTIKLSTLLGNIGIAQ